MASNYSSLMEAKYTIKMNECLKELPAFIAEYANASNSAPRTLLEYFREYRQFFEFLIEENSVFKNYRIEDFTVSDMNMLRIQDFEDFRAKLLSQKYNKDTQKIEYYKYSERAKARKQAALKSLFKYLYTHNQIEHNPTAGLNNEKIHEKELIYLDSDEIKDLLAQFENEFSHMSEHQKSYYSKTRYRDKAIIFLLIGTGMRVSELVGLDVKHINLERKRVVVTRKGGNEQTLLFNKQVADAVTDYIKLERHQFCEPGGETNALFLSMQKTRLSVRSVERRVKNIMDAANIGDGRISPHKLRSSYAISLLKNTKNPYLVSEELGHKSLNTLKSYVKTVDSEREKIHDITF